MPSLGVTCPRIQQSNSYIYTPKKPQWYVNDVVRFSCNNGGKILGKENSTCTENGRWSNPPPECRGIQ